MPEHRTARAESRWLTVEDMKTTRIQCEYPWCYRRACEIHHIASSFRWKRDNTPTNLIAVCRRCHDKIHSCNTKVIRDKLFEAVNKILTNKKDKPRPTWDFDKIFTHKEY